MKKIGIMGGTFNPIHYGHLFLAENAYEQLGLDKVLFMPSQNPPHKQRPDDVTQQQRVDMLRLAIQENPHFEVSSFELEREGMTYTADTLLLLTQMNPDNQYYFIVGADSLLYMHQWKNPDIIFTHCIVVAACRDNVNKDQLLLQVEYLQKNYPAKVKIIDMPTIELSSREIKNRIATGKTIRYYVPDPVFAYISSHKLYTTLPEDDN